MYDVVRQLPKCYRQACTCQLFETIVNPFNCTKDLCFCELRNVCSFIEYMKCNSINQCAVHLRRTYTSNIIHTHHDVHVSFVVVKYILGFVA